MSRILLCALALVLALTTAHAEVEVSGARFTESVSLDERTLTLAGTGVATYRVMFTVYAAAFYVPEGTSRAAALDDDVPRRLDIHYFYEITPEQIIEAANQILDRQLEAREREAIDERLRRFQGWFTGVNDGDRYSMIYRPNEGTELLFNGDSVGTVPGADFARAYFGIWLDDEALSSRLRRDLLANLAN